MPTYEYLCSSCTHQWEEIQRITSDATEVCPKCAERTARRQITGGTFILKGGGWYADAYSSKPAVKEGGADASAREGGEKKTEKTETKTEKAEAKTEKAEAKAEPKPETKPAASAPSGTPKP